MTLVIRKAVATDTKQLAASLARAFEDDPVTTWLLPGDGTTTRRLSVFFELELKYLHLPHGEVYTSADLAAAALWAPPGTWQTSSVSLARAFPRLVLAFGRRLPLGLRVMTTVERVHPREPHWYLAVLGTEPARQGQGLGTALLAPVLQRCDRDGVPAYLESSKESNVAFYSRHGFEVSRSIDLPGGGPRMWAMWREPRP